MRQVAYSPRVLQSGVVHLVAPNLKVGLMDRVSEVHYDAHDPREVMFFLYAGAVRSAPNGYKSGINDCPPLFPFHTTPLHHPPQIAFEVLCPIMAS